MQSIRRGRERLALRHNPFGSLGSDGLERHAVQGAPETRIDFVAAMAIGAVAMRVVILMAIVVIMIRMRVQERRRFRVVLIVMSVVRRGWSHRMIKRLL